MEINNCEQMSKPTIVTLCGDVSKLVINDLGWKGVQMFKIRETLLSVTY